MSEIIRYYLKKSAFPNVKEELKKTAPPKNTEKSGTVRSVSVWIRADGTGDQEAVPLVSSCAQGPIGETDIRHWNEASRMPNHARYRHIDKIREKRWKKDEKDDVPHWKTCKSRAILL